MTKPPLSLVNPVISRSWLIGQLRTITQSLSLHVNAKTPSEQEGKISGVSKRMISHLVESQIDQMNVIRLVGIYPHPVVNLTEANKLSFVGQGR